MKRLRSSRSESLSGDGPSQSKKLRTPEKNKPPPTPTTSFDHSKELELRRSAINSNPKGVMVITPKETRKNGPFIAGYLQFSGTRALRDYTNSPAVASILADWITMRKKGFGIPGATPMATKAQAKKLFTFLSLEHPEHSRKLQPADLERPLPVSPRTRGLDRTYISWIVTMYQLLEIPMSDYGGFRIARGPPSYVPEDVQPLAGAFCPED